MKRTTVVLPDELAELLALERRRRNLSTAEIVRQALAAYLRGEGAQPKRLRFVGLGRSGCHDTAQRAEEILAQEWGRAGRSRYRPAVTLDRRHFLAIRPSHCNAWRLLPD